MNKIIRRSLVFVLLFSFLASVAQAAYIKDAPVVVISKIRQDDNPAVPGAIVEILLQVENQGSVAVTDLELTLVPAYPLSMYGGENATKLLGSLAGFQDAGDSLQVSYKLIVDSRAEDENVELSIRYTYDDGGVGVEDWYATTTIDVPVDNPSVGFQATGKMVSEDTVELFITNVGKNTARSVLAFIEGGNVYSIGDLSPGNLTSVYVSLPADFTSSDVLEIEFQYTDSVGARRTSTDFAPVYTGSVKDVEISLQDFSSSTLTLAVVNSGNFPLYAVSVGLANVPGSTESIIGNLEAGDYSLATFTLPQMNTTTERPAGMTRPVAEIIASVSYTDTLGERRVSEQQIDLYGSGTQTTKTFPSRTASTGNGTSDYLLIGLTGLAVIGGTFWYLKRRRSGKK